MSFQSVILALHLGQEWADPPLCFVSRLCLLHSPLEWAPPWMANPFLFSEARGGFSVMVALFPLLSLTSPARLLSNYLCLFIHSASTYRALSGNRRHQGRPAAHRTHGGVLTSGERSRWRDQTPSKETPKDSTRKGKTRKMRRGAGGRGCFRGLRFLSFLFILLV